MKILDPVAAPFSRLSCAPRPKDLICRVLIAAALSLAATTGPATPAESPARQDEQAAVTELYALFAGEALWTTSVRQSAFAQALAVLDRNGIDPAAFGTIPEPGQPEALTDANMTETLVRAFGALAGGIVSPQEIPDWEIDEVPQPPMAAMAQAIRNGGLAGFLESLAPMSSNYQALRAAYAHYRSIAPTEWLPFDTKSEIVIGSGDPRLSELVRRLIVLGDLSEPPASDAALSEAVKRFQARHGLVVDARIGSATLATLNVSPAARTQQIAANLEYWRMLPRQWPARYIAVNTAAAMLAIVENQHTTYTARVIVGDTKHATPVMAATITGVTFNPDWTIPRSIAVKEILPKLRRSPDYLRQNNIVILDRPDDEFGLTIDWREHDSSHFPFQLRQMPGPGNALGLLKFEMANNFNIYLHDTPNRSLFGRNVRTLSHGCIRVDCAQELAMKVIDSPEVWLNTNIESVIASGEKQFIPLQRPLPVYLLYFTAFVGEDGAVNFRNDVYGRDAIVVGKL